jgi:hypothetical protein
MNPHEFPETVEEIVVWKLEHDSYQYSQYMHYVQDHTVYGRSLTRILVIEWLHRVAKLKTVVTSVQTYVSEAYYLVSVAGILVCVLSEVELTAMYNGETRA